MTGVLRFFNMSSKKSFIAILISTIFSSIVAISVTAAWLSPTAYMKNEENPIEGIVQDKYYESGTGASDDPFIITKPRHLYNLAWLQYLGFYNKNQGIDNHQFYFRLGANIDMSQFGAIPPIGTELNPFVGNFDGRGYVISGVTVSNEFNDYTSHPSAIDAWDNGTKKQPHILGLFGVVGEYAGGNKPTTYDSQVNAFINTGITGATIKTVVQDTLMGIAAGYSSGTLTNIVVDASTLDVAKGLTFQNGTTAYDNYSNISDFTLVGYTTKTKQVKKIDETIYAINSTSGHEFNGAEQGSTTGWGGSIDMMSVTKRLQAIRDTLSGQQFVYHKTVNDYEGKADTETATRTDTNSLTRIKNDDDEIGHFNFITNNSTSSVSGSNLTLGQLIMQKYALLGGGHFETHNNYAKVAHTGYKISDGDGHYLKAATFTSNSTSSNNAGTIGNSDDSANNPTTVWSVPTSGSGYISTTYNYNDANSATTYYLYWTNNALRLSASTSSRTNFTREELNGKVRFKYDNKYLGYNGSNWTLIDIPSVLNEPEAPVQNPVMPTEPNYNSYLANSYQISYTYDSTTYYLSMDINNNDTSSQTSLSTSYTYGWKFMNRSNSNDVNIESLNNNTGVYIYTTVGGTNYYLKDGSNSPYKYYLVTSTNNAIYFTKQSGNNGVYTLKSSSSSGGNTYYLCFNTSDKTFQDRSAQTTTINTITIATTHDVLEAQYNAALAVYNEQIDYRDNQYPGLLEEYNASLATYNATFKLTVTNATVYGPDEKLSNSTTGTGMYYDEDDVTYFPLSTMNDTNQDYRPADNNTAYVVGGSAITANTTTYDDELTNVRFGYYAISGYLDSDYSTTDDEFKHIYTVDYQNNALTQKEITNDTTNYTKLTDAKRNLESVMKDQDNVYGLHFMEASISMNALTTAKYVKVNREVHQNYELPVNSIDFHLKEFGYINFMAGSYYSTDSKRNNSFFSLYQIERLDNNPTKINRILEVQQVYKHTSGEKNYSYVYKLSDGTNTFYTKPYKVVDGDGNKEWLYGTGTYANNQYVNTLPDNYTLAFDCARIKKNTIASGTFDKHAYYFEIPMNDGEFCLGSVEGAVGSYLMYLDIGANASKLQRTIFYEHFLTETKTFAYPVGVSLKTLPTTIGTNAVVPLASATVVDDSDSVCVKVTAGYQDDLTIDRNDGDVSLKRTAQTTHAPPIYQSEEVTLLHDYGSSSKLNVTYLSSVKKEYKRMTYFDVNVNLNATTVTVITDCKIDNGSYQEANRTIMQLIYGGKDTSGTPSSTYIYDASTNTDQRASMKVYNTNTGIRLSDANLLSFTALGIDESLLSNDTTGIITYRLIGEEYTETILIKAIIDTNNQTGEYYIYNGYGITLVPSGSSVTVIVKELDSNKTIYIGSTAVTGEDQEIVIPVPQSQP